MVKIERQKKPGEAWNTVEADQGGGGGGGGSSAPVLNFLQDLDINAPDGNLVEVVTVQIDVQTGEQVLLWGQVEAYAEDTAGTAVISCYRGDLATGVDLGQFWKVTTTPGVGIRQIVAGPFIDLAPPAGTLLYTLVFMCSSGSGFDATSVKRAALRAEIGTGTFTPD